MNYVQAVAFAKTYMRNLEVSDARDKVADAAIEAGSSSGLNEMITLGLVTVLPELVGHTFDQRVGTLYTCIDFMVYDIIEKALHGTNNLVLSHKVY